MDNNSKDCFRSAYSSLALAITRIAEKNFPLAESQAREAIAALEGSAEPKARKLLVRALTKRAVALARMRQYSAAEETLWRAISEAQQNSDFEGAGDAALTLLEELGDRLIIRELSDIYERAAGFLYNSQDNKNLMRLNDIARRVIYMVGAQPVTATEQLRTLEETWEKFSFTDEVHRYEALLIERALKCANGAPTQASRLLGFTNHQSFIAILDNRHKNLQHARTPIKQRRRGDRKRTFPVRLDEWRDESFNEPPEQEKEVVEQRARLRTILYAEDDAIVQSFVRETLESENWIVEAYASGVKAAEAIDGHNHYDLILLDNELPGINGIELVRRARGHAHRAHIPIVMFSGSAIESEALIAGANAYLVKPEDVGKIVGTITQLLPANTEPNNSFPTRLHQTGN